MKLNIQKAIHIHHTISWVRAAWLRRLYVADCSVIPVPVTGSPGYPAVFIGLTMGKILRANLP